MAGRGTTDGWIILRTAGRSTAPLAASLSDAGYETWTPTERLRARRPRANAREGRIIPIMPTYVFARANHLLDLLLLASSPTRQHDGFSVFHYLGKIPLVADAALEPLRFTEGKSAAKWRLESAERKGPSYAEGEQVRVAEGAAGGMIGKVVESDGRYTLVCFGGSSRIKISTFLLRPDGIGSDNIAAQAA